MNSIKVGAVEITALRDTTLTLDIRTFIPPYAKLLDVEEGVGADRPRPLPIAITSYVVRSGNNTVLIDTGMGPRPRAGMDFPAGRLDVELRGIGLDPNDITHVVHTHLHLDHVGWNTIQAPDGSFQPFFPRAKYLIQEGEWQYWIQPEHLPLRRNEHLRECVVPLTGSPQLELRTGESAIDANLTFVSTPGHTPGHVAIGVYSGGERAVIVGDASHHPIQLMHPDWSPTADWDPELSGRVRERLFDEAVDDGRAWIAGHWEFPGFGRLLRLDGQRIFKAL
jgi:glyoxylase-like metal-dependent hydrolase (beta-lactamase superfamily II)